jgi:hypothetical protein
LSLDAFADPEVRELPCSDYKANVNGHAATIGNGAISGPKYVLMSQGELGLTTLRDNLFVVFTEREERIRLISARFAEKEELEAYVGQDSEFRHYD